MREICCYIYYLSVPCKKRTEKYKLKPSDQAKKYGCKDLKQLQEFTGFTRPTLNKMCYEKPEKFRVFCVACVCDELGLTGQELRDYVKLKRSIEGK